MARLSSAALVVAFVAVCVPLLYVEWTEAQKTIKNSFPQSFSGSVPQSAYGGYETQRQPSSLAAPVQQQRRPQQQTYTDSQKTEPVRQPAAYQQQQEQVGSSSSSSSSYDQAEAAAEPAQYGAVAGSPGQDFPAYSRVPKTSFSCDGLPYDYGMYADEETGCQAYHLCYQGRKDSFLCGPGTVFNQRILHCDYWYSVDCSKSSQYYSSNAYMGSSQPEPGPAESSAGQVAQRPVAQGSSYKRTEISSPSNSINRPVAPPRQSYQQQQSANSFSRNTQQAEEGY